MKRNLLVFLVWMVVAPAHAVTTTVAVPPAPNAPPPSRLPASAAKAMADDSSGLRKGTVEAVSVGAGTFQVYGQRLTFDAQRVRVFGSDGKPSSVYSLKNGAKVRFTLDAADSMHRRVAVIYID